MSEPLIDLHDKSEGDIIGHAILFWSCLGCTIYLVFFEWIIFGRFLNNILCKLIFVAIVSQWFKCIVSNASLNYPYTYDVYWMYAINGFLGINLTYFSNVAYAYLLFADKLKQKRHLFIGYIVFHTAISIICMIAIFLLPTYGNYIGSLYFILSWFFDIIIIIRLYRKHANGVIKLKQTSISKEEMNKLLIIAIILSFIGGGLAVWAEISKNLKYIRGGGGLWYAANTIVMVYCGAFDFMVNNNKKVNFQHFQQVPQKDDDEEQQAL